MPGLPAPPASFPAGETYERGVQPFREAKGVGIEAGSACHSERSEESLAVKKISAFSTGETDEQGSTAVSQEGRSRFRPVLRVFRLMKRTGRRHGPFRKAKCMK